MAAQFNSPRGIAIDSSGNLFVADAGNAAVRKITPSGVVATLATGFLDGVLIDIAVDSSGNAYVVRFWTGLVSKITPAGVVTTFASGFHQPTGIAIDSSDNLFVSTQQDGKVSKITPSGTVTLVAVGPLDVGGIPRGLYGLAPDASGNLYVCTGFSTLLKITPGGVVSTYSGTVNRSPSLDGTIANALYWQPRGIAVDGAGIIYIADTESHAIRKISSGAVTTLAGSAGSRGSTDGTGSAAHFNSPHGVAVDSTGNVFVADTGNHTIRKITPAGVVTTFAGTAGVPGSSD